MTSTPSSGNGKLKGTFAIPSSVTLTDGIYTIKYYRQDGGTAGSGTTAPELTGWTADGSNTYEEDATTTSGSTAAKVEFWLGNDGVLYGNLDDRAGAEFAVALVTPTLDDSRVVIA